ncbi:NAD(P)/FAD-dependent oxidoreductase [Streptomyces sp. SAJ15]|uniref:FAD-dependent oxidoreductase n=1 Tax=Streptomyces sp. SAJ15 TaxID=2011095 RepID=UPI001186D2AF|nr:NAD(P)/FAD-dependent oxidoreductase [Streptomyces sp. SAJ15]TVL91139.1 hypothetical protein CD790_17790 [Streptomyces sp. SAJ15]
MTKGHAAPGSATADVVVCGSGVAGLAAACALGRLGLDVTLLEKKKRQPPVAKGEILQPGSLDTLQEWGVLPALEARRAVRLKRLVARQADGAELLAMDFGTLRCAWPWMLSHDHTTILECLAESLGASVRWRRGVLVEDVLTDAHGRVVGVRAAEGANEYDIRARLVVAADGMSSRLRRLAGMTADPVAYGHKLLTLELSGTPAPADEASAYLTERGLVLVYPLPDGRTRVYVQVKADELRRADQTRLQRWCDELLAAVPALDPLAVLVKDSLDRRQLLPVWRYRAPSLVRPGIVLVGEAAHGVHPLAAQGMNTAIGDARALAARLATVRVREEATLDEAMRAYEAERMGRIRDIHFMSHDAARLMTGTSPGVRRLNRHLLVRTAKSARLRYLTTYNVSGVGMRPLGAVDRLVQLGVLPARGRLPRPGPAPE